MPTRISALAGCLALGALFLGCGRSEPPKPQIPGTPPAPTAPEAAQKQGMEVVLSVPGMV